MPTADNVLADLEKQIGDLQKQMTKITKSISARASNAIDDAEDAYDDGSGRVRQVARQVRDQVREQANYAVGAVRENPGTTATVLSAVALAGIAAGLIFAGAFSRR